MTGSQVSAQGFFADDPTEMDIVGLSVIDASPQYILKFNTLREHLQPPTNPHIQEHPIVKLLRLFRDSLQQYIKDSESGISKLLSFYDRQGLESEKDRLELVEKEKLLKRIIREIKSFVELMHDAVVRFYKLDVKMSMDVSQCECLTNLLTSIILKNPIYSDVHCLFQFVHKNTHVRESMKVMAQLRKRPNLG